VSPKVTHDVIWQFRQRPVRHPLCRVTHSLDRLPLDNLQVAGGVVHPLKNLFMVPYEPKEQPGFQRRILRRGSLFDVAVAQALQIILECARLLPINKAAHPIQPGKPAVDQLCDSLGAGLPGQRRSNPPLEARTSLGHIENEFRQFFRTKRGKGPDGESGFAGHEISGLEDPGPVDADYVRRWQDGPRRMQ